LQKVNQSSSTIAPVRPGWFTRFKSWWHAHHERLISIEDTPHSIALGLAIGIFFGFTPLWSVKTLLSIGVAWLFNCNKIAAVISVTLHDVILPFLPAIYWWEYKIGYWMLHAAQPHHIRFSGGGLRDLVNWSFFVRIVWPTLVGSLFFALPSAIALYFLARWTVKRTHVHRQARSASHSDS
jgi:uncharacterized protein (DUF2062 family)